MKHFVLTFVAGLALTFTLHAQQSSDYITYKDYGAVGDGVADDFDAILKAHEAANKSGQPVRAEKGAAYYIGGADKIADIQTNTDWTGAKFIIDDRNVDRRTNPVFGVTSKLSTQKITAVTTLKKNQEKLDLTLPHRALIDVTDRETLRYIRYGANQNKGTAQTDVFIVDQTGVVDKNTPIIWDFDNISSMTVHPIDSETLTIKGGHFTTIANQEESKYNYFSRGIRITRSNVVLDGLTHIITGEGDHGAPYGGFIVASLCADVTVQNCTLSGHKIYQTIGNGGVPVSMGSYDLSVNRAVNVTFKNCKQTNNIHDPNYWGILGSNFSKNITYDTVEFSRFDAHMGVTNATIKNSTLGHQGINLIGHGKFLLENSTVCGSTLVNLRSDYGSTFNGEVIIRNCTFKPRNGARSDVTLLGGSYSGKHNFGYTCYMPKKITVQNLIIDDSNAPEGYKGPKLFASFNREYTSAEYREAFPYVVTEEVIIENMTTKSGRSYILSNHPFMFRNVKITEK